MLLAIDIGNTSVHLALLQEQTLIAEFREQTLKENAGSLYENLFTTIKQHNATLEGIVVGSVAPELDELITKLSKNHFSLSPLFVSTKLRSNIINLSERDTELGADRLADIVATIEEYPGNRIVVDLGTATKFEVISEKNEYLGGAISPGLQSSFDALIEKASKLSQMKLKQPEKIIGGFTTEEHLNSGFIYGFAGLIEGMIQRIIIELKWGNPVIILTGGYSAFISKNLGIKVTVNQNLTLQGLSYLWRKNTH